MKFTIDGVRVISKKNSRVVTMVGNRPMSLPSKAYKEFVRLGGYQVWIQWDRKVVTKPFALRCEFVMKGKVNTDVDNMFTSVLDLLQTLGIVQNDSLCVEGSMTKKSGGKDFFTTIIFGGNKLTIPFPNRFEFVKERIQFCTSKILNIAEEIKKI